MSCSIGLVNWKSIDVPKFVSTAILACNFTESNYTAYDVNGILEAVIFVGSSEGEIIRWVVTNTDVKPVTASFAHTSRIVQFVECTFPIIKSAVVSLSSEGTLAVWNAIDGSCVRCYKKILPKGCQRIATSRSAIEVAVVSGYFPNIYVTNLQTGSITQKIHPAELYPIGLSFYFCESTEWLFTLEPNGSATYTSLRETEFKRFRVYDPGDKTLLGGFPSPDFSYLVITHTKGYAVISMTEQRCTCCAENEVEEPIVDVVWLDRYNFAVQMLSGSYITLRVSPPTSKQSHADIIRNLAPTGISISITSSILGMSKERFKAHMEYMNGPMRPLSLDAPTFQMELGTDKVDDQETAKSKFKLDEIERAMVDRIEVPSPIPVFNTWRSALIFAFNDTIVIGARQYQEYKLTLKSSSKKPPVTAQCFLVMDKVTIGFIQGRADGSITMTNFGNTSNKNKIAIPKHHKGRIRVIHTFGTHLFTSGDDCILNLYKFDGKRFTLVKQFAVFTTPVISFQCRSAKTMTEFDDYIFCVTEDGTIAVIDPNKAQLLFLLTGHETSIESIHINVGARILMVKCRSLYFWSMITGDLESVVSGSQMTRYLDPAMSGYVKITPPNTRLFGIRYIPIRFGSMSLRIAHVDVKSLVSNISAKVGAIAQTPEGRFNGEKALNNLRNFRLIIALMNSKVRKHLCDITKNKMKRLFRIASIGNNNVPTVFLPGVGNKGRTNWQISPQASAVLMVTRISIAEALCQHEGLRRGLIELQKRMFSLIMSIPDFKHPDVFLLFKYTTENSSVRRRVMTLILQMFSLEQRKEWITSLPEAISFLPNQKDLLKEIEQCIAESVNA